MEVEKLKRGLIIGRDKVTRDKHCWMNIMPGCREYLDTCTHLHAVTIEDVSCTCSQVEAAVSAVSVYAVDQVDEPTSTLGTTRLYHHQLSSYKLRAVSMSVIVISLEVSRIARSLAGSIDSRVCYSKSRLLKLLLHHGIGHKSSLDLPSCCLRNVLAEPYLCSELAYFNLNVQEKTYLLRHLEC